MIVEHKVASREVCIVDEQKKQKVVLALVPVLVLGAGTSFWYFGRDSGSTVQKTADTGPMERRVRVATSKIRNDRNKRHVKKTREEARPKVRDRREVTSKKEDRRGRRPDRKEKVEKRKKIKAG